MIVEHFDQRARSNYADVDALFMVGVLRYLLHETPAASYAVEVGLTLGDADASVRNLQMLLER